MQKKLRVVNGKLSLGLVIALFCTSAAESELDDEKTYEQDEETNEFMSSTTYNTTINTLTVRTITKDYCHCDMEIYGINDLEGILKSPNYPEAHCGFGECIYKILPHPNMTLRISVLTASMLSGTSLKFWNILDVDAKEHNLFHSEFHHRDPYNSKDFQSYQEFVTAKNVGFKVVFEMQKQFYSYNAFKISFQRVNNDEQEYICDQAHVIISEKETEVSIPKYFMPPSGCVFFLSPSIEGVKNKMQEMFITIETNDTTYVAIRSYDDEGYFEEGSFLNTNRTKLVDASRVEVVFRRKDIDVKKYWTPKITAHLTNRTCSCPEPLISLKTDINIRYPGFPDLYCPSKYCETIVNVDKSTIKNKDVVPLITIMANCSINELDNLKVSSLDSGRMIFRTTEKNTVATKFLRHIIIDQQNLKISFESSSRLQYRYFDISISQLFVEPECACSKIDEEDYDNSGWISVVIPSKCHVIHCHWKFSADQTYPPKFISLEFSMENSSEFDKVFVITDTVSEEYESGLLVKNRRFTSSASPIEFTFSRFHNAELVNDAVLNVSWKFVKPCECINEKIMLKENEPAVITSPNYPELYCPNLVCRQILQGPERHYLEIEIDDADIEKYHDFLDIYDGNNTSASLIGRVTGKVSNRKFNSSLNTVLFVFTSDETNCNIGYHAHVIARRLETEPGLDWMTFIFFTAMILFMVSLAVFFVTHKKANYRQFQSLNNPTISYTSSEAGSSVNISFGSVNNDDRNGDDY